MGFTATDFVDCCAAVLADGGAAVHHNLNHTLAAAATAPQQQIALCAALPGVSLHVKPCYTTFAGLLHVRLVPTFKRVLVNHCSAGPVQGTAAGSIRQLPCRQAVAAAQQGPDRPPAAAPAHVMRAGCQVGAPAATKPATETPASPAPAPVHPGCRGCDTSAAAGDSYTARLAAQLNRLQLAGGIAEVLQAQPLARLLALLAPELHLAAHAVAEVLKEIQDQCNKDCVALFQTGQAPGLKGWLEAQVSDKSEASELALALIQRVRTWLTNALEGEDMTQAHGVDSNDAESESAAPTRAQLMSAWNNWSNRVSHEDVPTEGIEQPRAAGTLNRLVRVSTPGEQPIWWLELLKVAADVPALVGKYVGSTWKLPRSALLSGQGYV